MGYAWRLETAPLGNSAPRRLHSCSYDRDVLCFQVQCNFPLSRLMSECDKRISCSCEERPFVGSISCTRVSNKGQLESLVRKGSFIFSVSVLQKK
jgi:hypothetical protein